MKILVPLKRKTAIAGDVELLGLDVGLVGSSSTVVRGEQLTRDTSLSRMTLDPLREVYLGELPLAVWLERTSP